jgi:dTDP-4-amino-4,6-dideoxygalactose transaminase
MVSEKPFSLKNSIEYLFGKKVDAYLEHDLLFFMGRDALDYILQVLDVHRGTKVMLPAYTCVENLTPFIKRGVKLNFYDIDADLEADITSIEKSIEKDGINVVLYINYFGKIQQKIKKLKSLYGDEITLLEDCSHSLLSKDSGKTGDFVYASLRKILPVPDGGMLKARSNEITEPRYYPHFISDLSTALILFKEFAWLKQIHVSRRSFRNFTFFTGYADLNKSKYLPQSRISNRIVKRLQTDDIAYKRRVNYLLWEKKLKRYNASKVISEFNNHDCPFGYPILIRHRNKIVSALRRSGTYIKTDWPWHDMAGNEYARSFELSMNSITLPVHQNIDEKIIDRFIFEIVDMIGTDWCYEKSFCN